MDREAIHEIIKPILKALELSRGVSADLVSSIATQQKIIERQDSSLRGALATVQLLEQRLVKLENVFSSMGKGNN